MSTRHELKVFYYRIFSASIQLKTTMLTLQTPAAGKIVSRSVAKVPREPTSDLTGTFV